MDMCGPPATRIYLWFVVLVHFANAIDVGPKDFTKRRVAKVDGDIIIGALFPVHTQPSQKLAYTRQCGNVWEQYGMHRIEIFLRTLDEINANPKILSNVSLGCDIRDSCWYPPVALEQSIDFIKNSIASLERLTNRSDDRGCTTDNEKPIAGFIGPGSSTVTVQVQNLLSLFNIPQIGYSATSKDLSNKNLYRYFLRVVPSDKLQAKALVDFVVRYNWTYISTVFTEGNYGSSGIEEFKRMAKKAGICEAAHDSVPNNAEEADYDRVIKTLQQSPNARVVVCFCEGNTVRALFKAVDRLNVRGHFLFIGSDGWAVRPDVVEGIEDVAAGGMSVKLYSPLIDDFDEHYFSLRPDTNKRNPWFKEFWQERFHCYLDGPDRDNRFNIPCTGNEQLSNDYVQDSKLGFVINAIYTVAYALDAMHRDICHGRPGICQEMSPVNGSIFIEYLKNVSFLSYSNDRIMFNENGDPPGRYEFMNFQRIKGGGFNGSDTFDYVKVGSWDSGNLTMNNQKIFWPNPKASFGGTIIESVCSRPCPRGEVKTLTKGVSCCWVCSACKENEFLLNENRCKACPEGWWPNKDLTACMMIHIEHIQWSDSEAVVAICFSCVGVITTLFVIAVFIKHNHTPVVKASTRELSYIILVGICTSYAATFPLVAKPSLVTCYMTRIMPGFSFAFIYGALVTKTNRIARILAGSKKKIMTRKPRFMSASAQVLITCIIIGIECAIITIMLILEPADSKLVYPSTTRVKMTCNATTRGILVPLGFDIVLIGMCTLYAIKTRNVPENFNEAKFIGFTMYTTCIVWLAFVPIYFGSDNKVITMCLAITLSASVALVLLFFPKIYIIVCKPERNSRSAFTTSKDVRCHIGSQISGGRSYSNSNESMDREKSFEGAAMAIYRQKSFFNRWKNKSIRTDGKQGTSFNRYLHQKHSFSNDLAQGRSRGSDSLRIPDSSRTHGSKAEGIPLRERNGMSPIPGGGRSGRTMEVITESEMSDPRRSRSVTPETHISGGGASSRTMSHRDICVQTDDDLLQFALPALRRRIKNSDSSESDKSRDENSPTRHKSRKTSKSSSSSRGSARNNDIPSLYSLPPPTYETDSLLLHEHKPDSMDHHLLHAEEQSPLLASAEASPLLSADEKFACDSTSEETLSDHSDFDKYDDIEDLLTGADVCDSQQGSFNSIQGVDKNGGPKYAPVPGPSFPPRHYRPRSPHNKRPNTGVKTGTLASLDTNTTSVDTLPIYHDEDLLVIDDTSQSRLRAAKSAPSLTVRQNDNGLENRATPPRIPPSERHGVPEILVDLASSCPNDPSGSSLSPSVDSGQGRTGSQSVSPGFDSSRRPSAASSSSGEGHYSAMVSLEELSVNGMNLLEEEADSVTKFQEYLRTRGVELDLNNVQSSDV